MSRAVPPTPSEWRQIFDNDVIITEHCLGCEEQVHLSRTAMVYLPFCAKLNFPVDPELRRGGYTTEDVLECQLRLSRKRANYYPAAWDEFEYK